MDNVDQLIEEVIKGNEDAFKELLENFKGMIYHCINAFNLKQGDYVIDKDDLFQEGSLALHEACLRYKKYKGARFSSYTYLVVKNRMIDYLRSYNKKVSNLRSIDDENFKNVAENISSKSVNDNPILYHRELNFRRHFKDFVERLDKSDQKILHLKMSNYSYAQIAYEMNIDVKRVDNRLAHIRRKLKNELNDV